MIGLHYCSATNSTHFTNCCGLAITDREWACPGCGEEVYPGKDMDWAQRMVARNKALMGRDHFFA